MAFLVAVPVSGVLASFVKAAFHLDPGTADIPKDHKVPALSVPYIFMVFRETAAK
jgi:hypothetical protein